MRACKHSKAMQLWKAVLAAMAVTVSILCFGTTSAQNSKHGAIRVVIDIFSGRPNPSFFLDEEEEEEMLRLMLDGARGIDGDSGGYTVRPNRLGYRGIKVLFLDDSERPYEVVEIFGGKILRKSAGSVAKKGASSTGQKRGQDGLQEDTRLSAVLLEDVTKRVERSLLNLALEKGALDDTLWEHAVARSENP